MFRIKSPYYLASLIVIGGLSLSAPAQKPEPTGASISGKVETNGGDPKGLVVLTWSRDGVPVEGTPQSGSLRADSKGEFRLAGLAPGNYRVCAHVVNDEFLDPCEWGEPIQVQIGDKSTDVRAPKIALQRGKRLQLYLNDPAGLLVSPESRGASGAIVGGLWLPNGRYIPLDVKRQSKAGLVLETIVPANINLRVQLRRLGVRIVQAADTPPEDLIQALENPAGFGTFSGPPGKPRVLRFEVQPADSGS